MATVTSFLDAVAALAKGGTDLLGNGEIFSLNSHSIKTNRMAAHSELLQLLFVALPAFFRKDHGFLFRCGLVIDVTTHTMDVILCVFRFDPRLEKSGRHLLMAMDTESRINSFFCLLRGGCTHEE
jgi:hypothetical protein